MDSLAGDEPHSKGELDGLGDDADAALAALGDEAEAGKDDGPPVPDVEIPSGISDSAGGEISAPFIDLGCPLHRRLFTNSKSGTVSEPTCAAHTMALYRRLPHGWRTTPPGFAPDKYMWAQCLADPRTAARSGARPTAILFPDPPRRRWPLQRRLDELRDWSARLDDARAVQPQRIPDLVLRGYELSLHLPFGRRALTRFFKRALAPRSAPAGE